MIRANRCELGLGSARDVMPAQARQKAVEVRMSSWEDGIPPLSELHLELDLPRRSKIDKDHHAALPFVGIADFMRDLASRSATGANA